MTKKILYQFFFAAICAFALIGCSNELKNENSGKEDNNPTDAVYMNVTVQMPIGTSTRSSTNDDGTSTDGTEVGSDSENKVHSVLLVLADKDNKYICCAEKSESLQQQTNGQVTTVQSISKSVLSQYYGGSDGSLSEDKQQVNVFVFCNPTSTLKKEFENLSANDNTWFDKICSITEKTNGTSDNEAIWGGLNHEGGFLMSSFEIASKTFPAQFSAWNAFTSLSNPFNLTGNNPVVDGTQDGINNGDPIKVERSVARLDFKDGSAKGENMYDVVKDPDDDGKYIVQIQLQKMALVNMSNSFYYLRRVSTNGLNTAASLCGIETSSNYVVDTDAEKKNDGSIIADQTYEDHFNFCLGHKNDKGEWGIDELARNQWFTSNIEDILNGKEDHPNWGTDKGDYRVWRYITENTIPGEMANQKNGITTGIVFKGKMIAPEQPKEGTTPENTLASALNYATGDPDTDPILYIYGTDIFVRWTEVRAMAIKLGQGSPLFTAAFGNTEVTPVVGKEADGENPKVDTVYSDDPNSADYLWNEWYNKGKDKDALKNFKKAATKASFTLYQSSVDKDYGNGYYCYYFYWNRHNDNNNVGVMAPMEFAVVRNNVYKLAVTKINKLGHPRITENDPDPVDPENPDEQGDVYLSVSVEVLPWVVRVNDIEF